MASLIKEGNILVNVSKCVNKETLSRNQINSFFNSSERSRTPSCSELGPDLRDLVVPEHQARHRLPATAG